MRIRSFGVMALIAVFAFVVRAEEDPEKSEAADAQKRMDAMFAGMTKFVGDTRLNEKGVKSILEHWRSFDAAGASEDEDNAIENALEASFRKTGAYDFGVVLNHAEFKKWAAKVGVDGAAWMKQYMRATLIFMRTDVLANHEQMTAQMKQQLAELEKMKAQLGAQYEQVKKAMEQSMAVAESMAKAAKKTPEPDKAEQELLKKYGDKLRATLDDDEEDMEDDGGSDDDDDDGDDGDDGDDDEG